MPDWLARCWAFEGLPKVAASESFGLGTVVDRRRIEPSTRRGAGRIVVDDGSSRTVFSGRRDGLQAGLCRSLNFNLSQRDQPRRSSCPPSSSPSKHSLNNGCQFPTIDVSPEVARLTFLFSCSAGNQQGRREAGALSSPNLHDSFGSSELIWVASCPTAGVRVFRDGQGGTYLTLNFRLIADGLEGWARKNDVGSQRRAAAGGWGCLTFLATEKDGLAYTCGLAHLSRSRLLLVSGHFWSRFSLVGKAVG